MKPLSFVAVGILAFCFQLLSVQADVHPTAFEQALYDKSRYQVVCGLSDQEFVSYCVTMNVGGDTLLKFHDEILAKQTELADLINLGLTPEDPKVMDVNATLKDLRAQYTVKISEARKGLEIESKIADETLRVLSQAQK